MNTKGFLILKSLASQLFTYLLSQNIRKYNPNEPELTYFGNERKVAPQSEYDLYFAFSRPVRFDRKKTRDNRNNMQEIRENIFEQVSQCTPQ